MKSFRVLLMTAALLASASVSHAQSLVVTSLQALGISKPDQPGVLVLPDGSLQVAVAQPTQERCCEGPSCATLMSQVMRHCSASFQRVYAACSGGSTQRVQAAPPVCATCPSVQPAEGRVGGDVRAAWLVSPQPVGHPQVYRIYAVPLQLMHSQMSGCCGGPVPEPFMDLVLKAQDGVVLETTPHGDRPFRRVITAAVPGSEIKHLIQFVQAPPLSVITPSAPCCCSKACACCESCKAQPAPKPAQPMMPPAAVWTQPVPSPLPAARYQPPVAPPMPVAQQTYPMVPFVPSPMAITTPPGMIPMAPPVKPLPRFETPDLEAHCEKITHRGDTVILEGNVLLLIKKHAQPVRINASRVVFNMKDGSYTVENAQVTTMTTTSAFGVTRTTAGPPQPLPAPVPAQRIIQIVPVPPAPSAPPPAMTPEMWQELMRNQSSPRFKY